MLFCISKGSKGEGKPSYTLRLPFELAAHNALKLTNDTFELLGHPSVLVLEEDQYVLIIKGFESAEAANAFLYKACAGLIWVGLTASFGIRFQVEATPWKLHSPPRPINENASHAKTLEGWTETDGQYDGRKTTVVAEHKRLVRSMGGKVRGIIIMPTLNLAKAMMEGMSKGKAELVLRDPKLSLACEVYLSSPFESTPAASFLSRITALEILAFETKRSGPVLKLVERFGEDTSEALENECDASLREEYQSLKSSVSRLRHKSISSGIRELVESTLGSSEFGAEGIPNAKKVAQLYGLRSKLVHEGYSIEKAIRLANNDLGVIVPQILRKLFEQRCIELGG